MSPVSPSAASNARPAPSAFCPVLPSRTSRLRAARLARLRHHALDLAQLLHQVSLCRQAARGIGEHHVVAAARCGCHGVEHHGGGIAAPCWITVTLLRSPQAGAARAPRPGTCRRRRAAPKGFVRSHFASLPIDVVLPAPFTPASMMTNGRVAEMVTSASSGRTRSANAARTARAGRRRRLPGDNVTGARQAGAASLRRRRRPAARRTRAPRAPHRRARGGETHPQARRTACFATRQGRPSADRTTNSSMPVRPRRQVGRGGETGVIERFGRRRIIGNSGCRRRCIFPACRPGMARRRVSQA